MINPKSLANLTPFGTISPDRQREISRAGGIASGATRRRKAAYKQMIEPYLSLSREEIAEIREIYHISEYSLIGYSKYIIGLHDIAINEKEPLYLRERAVERIRQLAAHWESKNSNEP